MAQEQHVPAASVWLSVWESAAAAGPAARVAALLGQHAAAGGSGSESLGACDARLYELRALLFGRALRCTTTCPRCAEQCEWDCDIDALRRSQDDGTAEALEIAVDGWRLRVRPLTAADLYAIGHAPDEAAAVRGLLERCVLEASESDRPVAPADLPAALVERVSNALAQADPQADMAVELACPACAHQWESAVDIGAFLWTELDAWAQRTLSEVHELALRYGWNEREILMLSPVRRARYLAMGDT